jgi:PPOX class probable F420-dependent enzyme
MSASTVHDALRFLESNHHAVLITRRHNAALQSSPVAAVADPDGHILISTRTGSAKEQNVARNPAVSICVVSDTWYGPWVHVDGNAEIVRLPDAMDLLIDYYRRASGAHPDWDAYRQAMSEERRVVLRVKPQHATELAQR